MAEDRFHNQGQTMKDWTQANTPKGRIQCPTCSGFGHVAEDFLTESHVGDVFSDYLTIFQLVEETHNVTSYEESLERGGPAVIIYTEDDHRFVLPRIFFTRNRDSRKELMRLHYQAEQELLAERNRVKSLRRAERIREEIIELQQELADLSKE